MVLSDSQVISLFGDPDPYVDSSGHILSSWESRILTTITLPARIPFTDMPGRYALHVRCHKRIAAALMRAFNTLYLSNQWELLKDYAGCYCWRTQRQAAHERSRHSWGIAIDINAHDNPMMGTPQQPPALVLAFKQAGFAWGGDFVHRPDGMHFEFNDPKRLTGSLV